MNTIFIHSTAEVSEEATIGEKTKIWNFCKIREGAFVGKECNLGQGVYIDFDVQIGSRVKIGNYVSVFNGVTIEDGVFIGPHVCFSNDLTPRAITLDGWLQTTEDWHVTPTFVQYGASIGANSTILAGVTIGRYAMVGAGSVVSRSVANHALVYGNPARLQGYVCRDGHKIEIISQDENRLQGYCRICDESFEIHKS